ncbi:MAG: M14 family metallopeptidase [Bacteroidota bacterium]
MKNRNALLIGLLCCALGTLGCSTPEKFTGLSYDPPGSTNTKSKPITTFHKRTIGAGSPTVWITNQFDGARYHDFYAIGTDSFEIVIEPENAPINNSAWYAFSIWSDSVRSVHLHLTYRNGNHRYHPKISTDGNNWQDMDESAIRPDTAGNGVWITLEVTESPIWISAQEKETTEEFEAWLEKLVSKEFIGVRQIGQSTKGRPIKELIIDAIPDYQKRNVLILMSRQHPPEVPGYLTALYMIEELASTTALADSFRNAFEVRAYPFINPDGTDLGHWRHNAGGVDLNRDWKFFNQPEVAAIRDWLSPLTRDSLRQVVYGIDFHSTNENIFYPILPEIKTQPDNLSQLWIPQIQEAFPDILFSVEAFDVNAPISKNWIYRTFGCDALTYEVDDAMPRNRLEEVARESARLLMKMLLDKRNLMKMP